MAALLHAEPGTDLRAYVGELIDVIRVWDNDVLQTACADVHRLPDGSDVAIVGRYVFSAELQHRLHGKPAPSYARLLDSGLTPFGGSVAA
jgi:hypothetical protein